MKKYIYTCDRYTPHSHVDIYPLVLIDESEIADYPCLHTLEEEETLRELR